MSDAHGIARDQLRAFIQRIERLEEEKKTIADDIKDVYGEAKSMGFDAKILRKVISIRKQDADERAEQEAILDTYLHALGMIQLDIFEEPETSPKLVATVATAMQTQAGRAALLTAVDIMIEREERFDAETGEILDDIEASAGTAPAVETSLAARGAEESAVSNSEIAPASQGGTASPSPDAELSSAGANAGGGYVESSAERAGSGNQTSDTYPLAGQVEPRSNVDNSDCASGPDDKRAPLFAAKPPSTRRPHCLDRAGCGSYTEEHCARCKAAMQEREQAEEVA
ncbi:DUF2312 domain-containing protein [Sinorhizobium meliloti]|uniref:DUF2312 domain-containing protein n=1 Tax=Rhizobium meliloti TaxID=382 RepID=UPI000B4A4A43|nr:DUF2312 domain-containing protein [Sinorhizobium meliloti]ASP70330.1 DUF2312 domain-containing protein [Sinorhizobium meliloti]MDE3854765.1 DUF2312 domain-containing protein [Sinorhizobium meliloti]MQW52443.1 DUF2312 domain-containing protein [Sinorhizobium meliloti]